MKSKWITRTLFGSKSIDRSRDVEIRVEIVGIPAISHDEQKKEIPRDD